MRINDAHCHFFSTGFLSTLGRQMPGAEPETAAAAALAKLGWDAPGSNADLADRWIAELDRAGVSRAAIIASVPGDGPSVAEAVRRHPGRFVGWFMADPTDPDAAAKTAAALDAGGLAGMCLFPAMQRVSLQDARVRAIFDVAAARPGTTMFVHCGALTVGVRKKLGLASRFDISLGNPLHVQAIAVDYPGVPIVIPHFGAGFFREALMTADLCTNVHLDTSSSNRWMAYHPGLTLTEVLRQALAVAGPDRVLFGSDSSFFPRGWVRQVFEDQTRAMTELGVDDAVRAKVFGGNFDRLFPPNTATLDSNL